MFFNKIICKLFGHDITFEKISGGYYIKGKICNRCNKEIK